MIWVGWSFNQNKLCTTESQKQAVDLARILARAIGIDIVFYDSTIEGTYGADSNGFFNEADSSIHLDLQKSDTDRKTIAYTMSHELVHFVKQWSPEKFDIFAEFLEENWCAEYGLPLEELVQRKVVELGLFGRKYSMEQLGEDALDTYERAIRELEPTAEQIERIERLAYEEVIADACERMLLDSKVVEKLAGLKKKDKGLLQRIVDHIRSLINRIRNEYRRNKYAPMSREAEYLNSMEEVLNQFYALFEDAALDAAANYQAAEGSVELEGKLKKQFKGVAKDGKKIYQSNFPQGTPKRAKSDRILNYIQDVWSKKPIELVISNGEKSRKIFAKFDPTIDPNRIIPTDASKIAGGNRHGSAKEQRVTLDLADDYYQIASEATYNYSKIETGKDLASHDGVKLWHYFVNDIYFAEFGEEFYEPYTVTINVKEKDNGDFVYSFNAEKEPSTRQTLHAAVNAQKGINGELFFNNNISQTSQNSQEKNNSTPKQRKASSLIAPGRYDVVEELASLYRAYEEQAVKKEESQIDAEGLKKAVFPVLDEMTALDAETVEGLRRVLAAIEAYSFEQGIAKDDQAYERLNGGRELVDGVLMQMEDQILQKRSRDNGWNYKKRLPRPGTEFDPNKVEGSSFNFAVEDVMARNNGADFAKDFAGMDPEEQTQFAADRQAEIDALFEMESEAARKADWKAGEYMKAVFGASSMIAEENTSPEAGVSTNVPEEKKSPGEKVRESWNMIQRKLVDSGDAVYDIGRREGDGHLYQYFNMARSSSNAGISMIQNRQTNILGDDIGKGCEGFFASFSCMYSNINYNPNELGCPAQMNCTP